MHVNHLVNLTENIFVYLQDKKIKEKLSTYAVLLPEFVTDKQAWEF